jgi:hypothetical protein
MTVEVLRLSGLGTDDALNQAEKLFDIRAGGPRQLRRLLVVDDAARLAEHEPVYHRLDRGRRVSDVLCVAVGALTADDGRLTLPENLGGNQGAGVIWVGDEFGIDWRFAAPTADGHAGGPVSGLEHLVELLTDDDLFKQVQEAFLHQIPGKVASPGLWLAGADAEDATFAAALAMAINRISQPGLGTAGPFAELLPDAAGAATLVPGGRLARDRNEVAEWVTAAGKALHRNASLGKLFGRGGGARDHVIEAGAVLGGLRDHVAQLFQAANAVGQPKDHQYQLIQAAGIQFPPVTVDGYAGGAIDSPVYRAVAEAIKNGDALPLVVERLQVTGRGLERKGSASYLPEVERRCPRQLLAWLADPPPRLPRPTADGGARGEFLLDDARRAGDALTGLAITVANREWSPATPSAAEVARVRVAVSSAAKTLLGDAHPGEASTGTRRARVAGRAESLRPVLGDLVLRVVAAACDSHGATGTQSQAAASTLTTRLLREWKEHVHEHGMSEPPSFATTDMTEVPALGANEGDAAVIREAVVYGPEREMWQLCLPDDLDALDLSAPPYVVRFAPRLNSGALVGTVPVDTVWTSSGAYAGLLRLVPVQDGLVAARRRDTDLQDRSRGW